MDNKWDSGWLKNWKLEPVFCLGNHCRDLTKLGLNCSQQSVSGVDCCWWTRSLSPPDSNVKRFFTLSGPTVHRALFSGPPASLYPELRNWSSVRPFTTATDTVRPLTLSLFCPSRATSPHGIINQPEARRLAWPPVTFGFTRFPSAICLWCTVAHPSFGPGGSSTVKNNSVNCSQPKSHLSCFTSWVQAVIDTPIPRLAMLSVTAANVVLRLLHHLAGFEER